MDDEFTPKMSKQFFEHLRLDNERKASELEEIRAQVEASTIPLPDSVLNRVLRLFPTDADAVLRKHRGFVSSERREHYHASLSVMFQSLDDLAEALRNFEALATAESAEIMMPKNRDKLEAIERRIQKELFGVANAAASLVDHARRLNAVIKVSDFKQQLGACFKDDGLHELVISLRVLLHHLHIVKANWSLSSNFATGVRTADFRINRDELERAIDQAGDRFVGPAHEPMRQLVNGWPKGINLLELFGEYRTRLEAFYSWLDREIETNPPADLVDFDRCMLEKNRRSTRMSWNALVGNWLNWEHVPDIHKHLPNYLTPGQLEEVYAVPRNSREQADLIIEILDKFGAVDEEFRSRIYRLFERLAVQEADDQRE